MLTSRPRSSLQHRSRTLSGVATASWASMALVQASDTAIFRSSTRSSASWLSVAARADTTRRARATNSARAGISRATTSPTIDFGPLFGRSGVDRVVDGEDLCQPGDLEHLEDTALGAHQQQVAVVAAKPLEPSDEHSQTGGVE